MACKVIIAAAAAALILSFLLPSAACKRVILCLNKHAEVVGREHIGNCPFWRSQVPECRTRMSCIKRCQDEGYKGGFCDGNKICMCSQCSDSTDDEVQVAQRSSPLLTAPKQTGAWA
ncbi:hypothetical protein BDA96_05G206100 [Sorghum bicolor]|uniref:Knottin scorpion toxin-like domain-containing protein n=1 Tax=Sorghum bicolor TaxID=4558 RepID=A0A921R1D3_SORBI|nr:hypothetical protein BDA96_05G206100 [Sorghum bicolor]